eukprot:UN05489
MPSLECGGGPPKELRWTLSGAIEEFYAPHPTFVTVQSTGTDDDYCKYKQYKALINSSNGTNISFAFMNMNGKEFTETPQIAIPEWRFEYYLIGGAITICMLVVINQFKEQKLDRIIAIMSGALHMFKFYNYYEIFKVNPSKAELSTFTNKAFIFFKYHKSFSSKNAGHLNIIHGCTDRTKFVHFINQESKKYKIDPKLLVFNPKKNRGHLK